VENTTLSGAFGFYAGIYFFGWIAVHFCYPEVKGMTLEDIREVFKHGLGVKYARQVQKDAKYKSRNQVSGDVLSVSGKV
jgi:SP family myo-inositol transporter-like MFS transporter 13